MKQFLSKVLGMFVLVAAWNNANAAIIYSGVQNLSFTATDMNTTQIVDLAGDNAGTWDNFSLNIFTDFAGQTSVPDAPAVLAYETQFPFIERYNFGDVSSNLFGSGTFFFYRNDNPAASMFANQTGYAGLMLGDFNGPKFFGWMQVSVEGFDPNEADNRPTVTIIDWAFSNVAGVQLTMGQVPEPPVAALMMIPLLLMVRLKR